MADDELDTDMDDATEPEEPDDDDDDQDDADTDDPAELKKRLARAAAALKKANAQAARLRKKSVPAKKAATPAQAAQSDAADQAGTEGADERFRRQAIRTEGAAAILEAGFQGDRKAARDLTRLLDHDELDVDDDGEVDGLDDAVTELKERYPGLFAAQQQDGAGQRRQRVGSIDANAGRGTGSRGARGAGKPAMTSAERLGMALRRGA